MVLKRINSEKREKILKFFIEKFNINLLEYNDDEISLIFDEINLTIKKNIVNEINKNSFLLSEIKKQEMILSVLDDIKNNN